MVLLNRDFGKKVVCVSLILAMLLLLIPAPPARAGALTMMGSALAVACGLAVVAAGATIVSGGNVGDAIQAAGQEFRNKLEAIRFAGTVASDAVINWFSKVQEKFPDDKVNVGDSIPISPEIYDIAREYVDSIFPNAYEGQQVAISSWALGGSVVGSVEYSDIDFSVYSHSYTSPVGCGRIQAPVGIGKESIDFDLGSDRYSYGVERFNEKDYANRDVVNGRIYLEKNGVLVYKNYVNLKYNDHETCPFALGLCLMTDPNTDRKYLAPVTWEYDLSDSLHMVLFGSNSNPRRGFNRTQINDVSTTGFIEVSVVGGNIIARPYEQLLQGGITDFPFSTDDLGYGSISVPDVAGELSNGQAGTISYPDVTTDVSNPDVPAVPGDIVTDAEWDTTINKFKGPAILMQKFPFCIPFDLYNVFASMVSPAEKPPIFRIPVEFESAGIHEEIVIDFKYFDRLVKVLRWFLCVEFVLGLILVTRRLVKG